MAESGSSNSFMYRYRILTGLVYSLSKVTEDDVSSMVSLFHSIRVIRPYCPTLECIIVLPLLLLLLNYAQPHA